MILLTMYLLRYCIIQPMLDYQFSIQLGTQMTLQLPDAYFLVLVLINILLGAGGYVINDYYDRRVDNINRPDSVVVDKLLPRRSAIIYHIALTAAAIVLAAIFAWHLHMISIFLLHSAHPPASWIIRISDARPRIRLRHAAERSIVHADNALDGGICFFCIHYQSDTRDSKRYGRP